MQDKDESKKEGLGNSERWRTNERNEWFGWIRWVGSLSSWWWWSTVVARWLAEVWVERIH